MLETAPRFLTDFRHLLITQELPAVAVWLSDAQYTGKKMTDEDDCGAVLLLLFLIRAQAPDSELDMWMETPFSGPE